LDEFTDTQPGIIEECDDRVVPQLEVRRKGHRNRRCEALQLARAQARLWHEYWNPQIGAWTELLLKNKHGWHPLECRSLHVKSYVHLKCRCFGSQASTSGSCDLFIATTWRRFINSSSIRLTNV
jgi:hypothetical protein